jgi:hypothetical protein
VQQSPNDLKHEDQLSCIKLLKGIVPYLDENLLYLSG